MHEALPDENAFGVIEAELGAVTAVLRTNKAVQVQDVKRCMSKGTRESLCQFYVKG